MAPVWSSNLRLAGNSPHAQQVRSVTTRRAEASLWCEFFRLCYPDAVRDVVRQGRMSVRSVRA